jgi:hypothetical protein
MEGGEIRSQKGKEQEGLLPKRIPKRTKKRIHWKLKKIREDSPMGKDMLGDKQGGISEKEGLWNQEGQVGGGGQGENTTMKGKEKEKQGEKLTNNDLPQGRWHPTHK